MPPERGLTGPSAAAPFVAEEVEGTGSARGESKLTEDREAEGLGTVEVRGRGQVED